MNIQRIYPTLEPGEQSANVTNLQQALRFLLDKNTIVLGATDQHLQTALEQEQTKAFFGDATQAIVRLFQVQYQLGDGLNGMVEAQTAKLLNHHLDALGAFEEQFVVKGYVRRGTTGYADVVARAFDRDLRRLEMLGEKVTDGEGYYEITYSPTQFRNAEKKAADVLVSLYKTGDSKEPPFATSETYFSAPPVQEVDFTLPAEKGPSEWEVLEEQVPPLLVGQKKMPARPSHIGEVYVDLPPEELTADDFEFLSKETGLEQEQLRLWALAYRVALTEKGLPVWAFYAWFKWGLPTDFKELLRRDSAELKKTLYDAREQNIISVTDDEIAQTLDRMAQLQLELPLRPGGEGKPASLGDVLKIADLGGMGVQQQQKFVEIAARLDPDADNFRDQVAKLGLLPKEQANLQTALRLAGLTQYNASLMSALKDIVASDGDASLMGLTNLAEDRWIDLAYEHGAAADSVLSVEEYALQLDEKTEQRLPTASLRFKIELGGALARHPGKEGVQAFLSENPAFNIVDDDIETKVAEGTMSAESKNLLLQLQNLKKMGVRWGDVDAFLAAGINTMAQMAEYSPEQLENILDETVAPEQIAQIHARATAAQNTGIALMGYFQPLLYGVQAYVMQPAGQEEGHIPQNLTLNRSANLSEPNLRYLFGVLEQCACNPCLSVLSPAAYYADLLRFIDASGNAGATLQARRPDLYDLELSCDNAQIELPHIDLALEILENKVAFPEPVALPSGLAISEQLKADGSVGEHIKNALQKTSEVEVSESLSAEKGITWPTYPAVTTWVVKDRYRRWALSSMEESLAFYQARPFWGKVRRNDFDLRQFKIADMLSWLNSDLPNEANIPTEFLKGIFEVALMDGMLAMGNLSYAVSKAADNHWEIKYEIRTFVITEIAPDSGQSRISIGKADGTGSITKEYGKKTVETTAAQLDERKLPRILKPFANGKHTTIESQEAASVSGDTTTLTPKNHILTTKKTIHLFYNPAQLYIQGLTYQSTKADADLFAQPQNRNPLAYEKLAATTAVYPWTLPYDQPLDETRLLLEKAGISRLSLMEQWVAEDFSKPEWVREMLGISTEQQKLLVEDKSSNSEALYLAWGLYKASDGYYEVSDTFQGGKLLRDKDGLNLLKIVSIAMQQARIDYDTLQALLKSNFINPDGFSTSIQPDCNPAEMQITKADNGFFDRLHRFIRLWRVLGWSIAQTDQALKAKKIGDNKLNNSTIARIAQTEAIHRHITLPLDTLLALFTPASNREKINLTLAQALSLPPDEYAAACRLICDNSNPATPLQVLQLVREAAFVRESGIKPTQLELLLAQGKEAELLPYERAAKALQELYKILNEVVQFNMLLPKPTGNETDEQKKEIDKEKDSIASKQKDAIIQFFTRLYEQDVRTTIVLLSKTHKLAKAGSFNQDVEYTALDFYSSPEFLDKPIEKDKLQGSKAYIILLNLYKIYIFNQYWRSTPSQLDWLGQLEGIEPYIGLKETEIARTPYWAWKSTTLLFKTAQTSPEMETTIRGYFSALDNGDTTDKRGNARAVFASAFGLQESDVKAGAEAQGMWSNPVVLNPLDKRPDQTYFDPLKICRLLDYLAVLQKTGLNANQHRKLVAAKATTDSLQAARQVLLFRHGAVNFADAMTEVQNQLRPRQRDVLTDYLIWKEQVRDADDLYKKYLIDVEMSACMRTTRQLQSTAAAQLFVHRCLLNLEPEINPATFDKKRWEWIQNYRVWEANRKVFLYPENWLYPELRDDKTAAFKNFETELSQNEASDKNAKDALLNYVESLVELSKITVMGMHEYKVPAGQSEERRLFQVGRTINPPYGFYWRLAYNYGETGMRWTGWEKIEQDLSADHVVPFTYGGDLCIAWPIIGTTEDAQKKTWYEVELAWTRRTNKGWTERKRSSDKFKVEKLFNRDEKSMFLFQLKDQEQDTEVEMYVAQAPAAPIIEYTNPTIDEGYEFGPDNEATLEVHFVCQKRYYGSNRIVKIDDAEIYLMGLFVPGVKKLYEKLDAKYKPVLKTSQDGNDTIDYFSSYHVLGNKERQSEEFRTIWFKMKIYFYNIDPSGSANEHLFDLEAKWKGQTIKHTNLKIKKGRYHKLTWSVLFDGGPETNEQEIQKASTDSLRMENKGVFKLFGNKDGEWQDQSLAPSLSPPENTYFYSSGLIERYSNDCPVKLLGDYALTSTSNATERYRAIPASKVNSCDTRAWQIEEGDTKLLVNVPGKGGVMPVILAAYPEAKSIKSKTSSSLFELFNLQKSTIFKSDSFGKGNLGNYNNGSAFKVRGGSDDLPLPFNLSMPYALYNWEIFFHLPLAAAQHLSKQHRFEEARQWFHYIFDPTSNENSSSKERFWRFLPFLQRNQAESAGKLLDILANPNADPTQKEAVENLIKAWLSDPFNPFAVARMRINAYEWFTVTAYIKNLIEWGDHLFRRGTRESINEATLLYVMASDILGRRPLRIQPNATQKQAMSYRSLSGTGAGFNGFSNTWVSLLDTSLGKALLAIYEALKKFGINPNAYDEQIKQLSSIGSSYFCVQPNDKILELWDTVGDRLYKIRNCQNFDGIARNLPLLDPPIDPELLIRAKAAGLSISDAINDQYAPPPLYRFNILVQKAIDLCNEVKTLGGALLSAIEKKEAEHITLLRSGQEIEMQKLIVAVREEQINEAAANIEALKKTRENIIARIVYLQRQMGGNETMLDADGVPVMSESYIGQPAESLESDFKGLGLTKPEVDQIAFMQTSNVFNILGGISHTAAGTAHFIAAGFAGTPLIGTKEFWTGIGHGTSALGTGLNTLASGYGMLEKNSGMMAGWQRRRDEWLYQAKTAVLEIRQIDKQIIASEIRHAIAKKELDNHRKQMEHTKSLDDYVRNQKFSKETLYTWMESQLVLAYKSAYNLAFEQAKKAEKAFQFELGDQLTQFVTAQGYWDTLHRGLLAGEGLSQALKKMEVAYLDRNRRELELTKHISLNQLNPLALLQLRENGTCNFAIPEELFDLDFPGHYFRRIKSVSITIPCVAGPYTTINAALKLNKNSTRVKAVLKNSKYEKQADDDRFRDQLTGIQSIATSSAQNDSGLFELNFRDERYLPFEGAGAISEWMLEMMEDSKLRQFDYNTISDVIVHMRYTAREGVEKSKVTGALTAQLNALKISTAETGLARLFSLRHDFPNEWHAWIRGTENKLEITLGKHHFPYFAQESLVINKSEAYEKGQTSNPTTLRATKSLNTGWQISGNLDQTKEDWFLIVQYTI